MEVAKRLDLIQEYYFSRKLKEVKELELSGKPIINMGIGSPDLFPPKEVISAISEAILEPTAHKYQSYYGLPEFREAIANFYKNYYRVSVDPQTEVIPLMGSKEGILHVSMAFLNKGDEVLIPNPGYPTYTSVTNLVEATPVFYSLKAKNSWLPDFEALEKRDLSKVKLMWVTYPHMPTGATATKEVFKQLIAFGKKHNILIVKDNPYSFVLNNKPLSILEIEGAKDVALELNSLSKTFNMAGWRVGMMLGKQEFLKEVLKVKTQMDSGMFYGIQKGAIAALQLGSEWFEYINMIYASRKEIVLKIVEKLGCTCQTDTAGMFVWAKLPAGITSEEMVDELLHQKDLFIAPGTIFGSNGEGYIRFSLCVSEAQLNEALSRL